MRDAGAFTARALVVGIGVGAIGAVSNVFVSLKAGWSLPVMTTAAVVGLGLARVQRRSLVAGETVVSTSLASAAAFATGGGNLAALPAIVLLGLTPPSSPALVAWFASTALAGTLLAPHLGRHLNELRFPTATATVVLARDGAEVPIVPSETNAARKTSRSLWLSALAAAVFALGRRALRVPTTIAGAYTFGLDPSLLLVAVGGLMTWTTAWSTLGGGLLTYGLIAPRLVSAGLAEPTYRSLVGVMVWPAASLLVASALTELALDLSKLVRAPRGEGAAAPSWPLLLAAVASLAIGHFAFGLSPLVLAASVPVALAFAYVAARSMGETDVVPTKALAPLAQALVGLCGHGVVGPAVAPNLTGAVAIHAADTLGSLKLAGALAVSERVALRARAVGCIVGAVVVVVTYRAVVPDASLLPTADLPVPAVLVWKSVAEVIGRGTLPPAMLAPIAVGAIAGIVLAVLSRVLPERVRPFVPSPMGLGSGMVLPASAAFSIFAGAVARRRLEPRLGLASTVAIASGAVAGESVVGVFLQLLA